MGRALVFLMAVSAFAQSVGTIAGTVSDTDGLRLDKAAIEAVNTATNASFTAVSGADGAYKVTLPAGTYKVASMVPGMNTSTRPNVVVMAGQTMRLDFRMTDFNSNTSGEDRAFYANLYAPPNVPTGPTPRAADGKPDLSGVWRPGLAIDLESPQPLPWATAKAREWAQASYTDLPTSHCLPAGMEVGTRASPFKIVQTPTLMLILFETGDQPRQIFLDGRSHPREFNPSWVGHSIGHWEGDVLVVDTSGFNDKSWMGPPFLPHTEQLRETERFHRLDAGHLEIHMTYDDPGALMKPWTLQKVVPLAPAGEEIEEYVCAENEKDIRHFPTK
jgi:hypothetical protein